MSGFHLSLAIAILTAFLARFLPFALAPGAGKEAADAPAFRALGLASQAMLGSLAFDLAIGGATAAPGDPGGSGAAVILGLLACALVLAACGRRTTVIWALTLGAYLPLHVLFG